MVAGRSIEFRDNREPLHSDGRGKRKERKKKKKKKKRSVEDEKRENGKRMGLKTTEGISSLVIPSVEMSAPPLTYRETFI